MPELAEIALYAEDLNNVSAKHRLVRIAFPNRRDWGNVIVTASIRKALSQLEGRSLFFGSNGKALTVGALAAETPVAEFRLGMTGQFHLEKMGGKWRRHYFLSFIFDSFSVHYADPRRFGRVRRPTSSEYQLAKFCPTHGLSFPSKIAVPNGFLSKPRISWLLDNGHLTGVGNYMANEALGRLDLSPFAPCKNILEAEKLLRECKRIAIEAFRMGGNSFGSGYYRLDGTMGGYADRCRYYQNPEIKRTTFRGRPVYSHFSPPHKFSSSSRIKLLPASR